MSDAPANDDVAMIGAWFEALAARVQAVDFAGARHLFAADMVAFGTFSDFLAGRDAVEAEQWRRVWPYITGFRWRLAALKALVAADRLSAVGMACFDSTGYGADGGAYDRPGRATVAFRRGAVGAPWVAEHTHMSLFRGTPQQSFGKKG